MGMGALRSYSDHPYSYGIRYHCLYHELETESNFRTAVDRSETTLFY